MALSESEGTGHGYEPQGRLGGEKTCNWLPGGYSVYSLWTGRRASLDSDSHRGAHSSSKQDS